jgi:hypothetical protein
VRATHFALFQVPASPGFRFSAVTGRGERERRKQPLRGTREKVGADSDDFVDVSKAIRSFFVRNNNRIVLQIEIDSIASNRARLK